MFTTPLPPAFDGAKFAAKYNLQSHDFYASDGLLYSPIENPDLSDCVITAEEIETLQRIDARRAAAKPTAKAIPNWATWTQAEWQNYFDAQLSDTQVNLVTSFAAVREGMRRQNLVIQNLVKLVIALRDEIYPDLPE